MAARDHSLLRYMIEAPGELRPDQLHAAREWFQQIADDPKWRDVVVSAGWKIHDLRPQAIAARKAAQRSATVRRALARAR